MDGKVRFLYLKDPEDDRHVVTVARRIETSDAGNPMVRFAWAINKVPLDEFTNAVSNEMQALLDADDVKWLREVWQRQYGGDSFSRKRGRQIASNRLLKDAWVHTVPFTEHKHTISNILEYLASAPDLPWANSNVKGIARKILDSRQPPPTQDDRLAATGRHVGERSRN